MRKRWSVVIVGQSGLALSHRAEVGRHRTEAAARRAAELEVERLVATRGGVAHGYRVVLELDGEEVSLDAPEPRAHGEGPLIEGLNGDPVERRPRRGARSPEPEAVPSRPRPPRPEIPEPPAGPVPEEILERWGRPIGREP